MQKFRSASADADGYDRLKRRTDKTGQAPPPRRREVLPPPVRGQRVGLKDVAASVGLSIAAVSRVLSDAPGAKSIPEPTKQRIVAAAKQLGYTPNALARSLRSRSSQTIGVMVPELSEGYATLVLSGIEERLMEEGYFYFVGSHHRKPAMISKYQDLLMERAVEGIVAVDTSFEVHPSIPTVAVSGRHTHESISSIVLDHHLAAMQALGHLAELGHRRIAFIKGQPFSSDTQARWRSIVAAAKTLKIKLQPELVTALEGDAANHEPGYEATKRLIEGRERFTALFAFNDVAAIGAVKALRESGLRVPDDVSVVGFDDVQSAAFQNPPLTTVRQPLYAMGKLAAETLLCEIAALREGGKEAPAKRLVVLPELVVRASTVHLV